MLILNTGEVRTKLLTKLRANKARSEVNVNAEFNEFREEVRSNLLTTEDIVRTKVFAVQPGTTKEILDDHKFILLYYKDFVCFTCDDKLFTVTG